MAEYLLRLADPLIHELLAALPAVSIVGPRAVGKTTTATRYARSVVRLDVAAEARVVSADPDAALSGLEEPILLDEWQEVPAVLGAVKRACDLDPRPGRFILTGSVRAVTEGRTWPGTGRVTRVELFPLTVGEQLGALASPLVDRVAGGDPTVFEGSVWALPERGETRLSSRGGGLREYVRMALRGGFPQVALGVRGPARRRWLDTYIAEIVSRDVETAGGGVDPARLRRFFTAYALNTAQVVNDATLYSAAGIDRRTALRYLDLLERIYAVHELAAWTSNRTKRLAKSSKRFLVDASLYGAVTGASLAAAMRDADLLGRLVETFVVAQLRAQATVSHHRCELYHLRQHNGRHEVDVIAEIDARHIIGIEIKATSAPTESDARHLAWLRDQERDRFLAGLVLHTGPGTYSLGERLWALPISTLWNAP